MQTFLPYPDFKRSAEVLDNRRLGKQVLETLQIYETLIGVSSGWANHPAVLMWSGYERCLLVYGVTMHAEVPNCMTKKGHPYKRRKDGIKLGVYLISAKSHGIPLIKPPWLGNSAFHASHRSNLLRKAPEHYGNFGWTEPDDLPYIWPSKDSI